MSLSYSWSSLHSYYLCPYGWWLQYIVRFAPGIIDETGVVPGNVVHKLAELFFKAEKDWAIFDKEFDRIFEAEVSKSYVFLRNGQWASSKDEAYQLLKQYVANFKSILKLSGLNLKWYIVEGNIGEYSSPFYLHPYLPVVGRFDLVCGESRDSKLTLVDFKASESEFFLDKRQLIFYALMAGSLYHVSFDRVAFLLFKKKKFIPYLISEKELRDVDVWVGELVLGIKEQRFGVTPSKYACKLCRYRGCCKFVFQEVDAVVKDEEFSLPWARI